jgi:hypothetical protein
MKSFLVILASAFFFSLSSPVSAHNHIPPQTGNMPFSSFGRIYSEVGFVDMLKMIAAPKGERSIMYHTFAADVLSPPTVPNDSTDKVCVYPNKWYIEDANFEVCTDPYLDLNRFVCGQACPDERWTGAACGLGHRCCTPPGISPTPDPEKPEITNCSSGEGSSIQYCFL